MRTWLISAVSCCVAPFRATTIRQPKPGPRNLMLLVSRRVRMQGFIVLDYLDRAGEAIAALTEWVLGGEIAWREDIAGGL